MNIRVTRITFSPAAAGSSALWPLTEALDVVDTLIKGEDHLRSLGPEYLPRIGIFVLMCAVAATTRSSRFHALFVFGALVYEISFFGRYYATLN